RGPRQGPRLPEDGRRVHGRYDRRLHRAEDGRGAALRDDAAPGGVRYVLLGVSSRSRERKEKGRPSWSPFLFSSSLSVSALSFASRGLINHHGPNALARVHQIESLVDALERKRVRDHRVDLDLALH